MMNLTNYGITDFTAYFLGTIAIILLPGPNSLYCLYIASSQSKKHGLAAMTGILSGDTLLMLATVFGAATLLKTSVLVFTIFKVLGGLYLAYLGMQLFKGAYQSWRQRMDATTRHDPDANESPQKNLRADRRHNSPSYKQVYLKSITLSLSNPKAILFFLSFFIQFVDPSYSAPLLSFTILGVVLQLLSMTYLSILVYAGNQLAQFFIRHRRLTAVSQGAVGGLFISFAISLWRTKAN